MAKIKAARQLRFETLDAILSDAKKIEAQPDAATRGTWTLAQNIWHVARMIKASVEGYPTTVPFALKVVGPLFKARVTVKGFKPGIKLPQRAADHLVAPPNTTMAEAMALLQDAIDQAKLKGFIPTNPVFGKMTRQQWIDLHCRHAEMHFGLIELKEA